MKSQRSKSVFGSHLACSIAASACFLCTATAQQPDRSILPIPSAPFAAACESPFPFTGTIPQIDFNIAT